MSGPRSARRQVLILCLLGLPTLAAGAWSLWAWHGPAWAWITLAGSGALFVGWMFWEARQPPRPDEIREPRHPRSVGKHHPKRLTPTDPEWSGDVSDHR